MIDALLQNLDSVLLVAFGLSALVAAALMIVLRHPMQVAMALISTMVFLGGIYGLLGVHFIAAFQVPRSSARRSNGVVFRTAKSYAKFGAGLSVPP